MSLDQNLVNACEAFVREDPTAFDEQKFKTLADDNDTDKAVGLAFCEHMYYDGGEWEFGAFAEALFRDLPPDVMEQIGAKVKAVYQNR